MGLVEALLAIDTSPPPLIADADHIVEADLDLPTGIVSVVGCTQPPNPEHGQAVPAGRYRARVSYVPSLPPTGSNTDRNETQISERDRREVDHRSRDQVGDHVHRDVPSQRLWPGRLDVCQMPDVHVPVDGAQPITEVGAGRVGRGSLVCHAARVAGFVEAGLLSGFARSNCARRRALTASRTFRTR